MADTFIKFDGVDGESEQSGHEKWIEISGCSMDASTPGGMDEGSGAGVGKATIHGVSFTCKAGRHSPHLEKKFYEGTHFANATVHFLKQAGGEAGEKYFELTMQKVFITSMSSSKGEGSLGIESITLTAEDYTREYFAQDGSGALTSVGSTKYNNKTGVSS